HRRIVILPLPGERRDPRRRPAAARPLRFHDETVPARLLVEVDGGAVGREGQAIHARRTGDRAQRDEAAGEQGERAGGHACSSTRRWWPSLRSGVGASPPLCDEWGLAVTSG